MVSYYKVIYLVACSQFNKTAQDKKAHKDRFSQQAKKELIAATFIFLPVLDDGDILYMLAFKTLGLYLSSCSTFHNESWTFHASLYAFSLFSQHCKHVGSFNGIFLYTKAIIVFLP